MKIKTVTSRTEAITRAKAEIQVVERKQVTRSTAVTDVFSRNRSRGGYTYENTSSYEKFVNKQGKVKQLKITELKRCGSAVRAKRC